MSTVTEKKMTEKEERAEDRALMESVRKRVLAFGNEMQQYFEHIHADVENYRFVVEKHADGLEIEVNFKAFVHPATKEATKVIPK